MRFFSKALIMCLAVGASASADIVRIGKYPAKIVPEQVAVLTFQSKGMVSDLLKNTDARIEKGTVVAVLDKEKTAEAREDMELQLTRERLTKRDEVRKLQVQREKLRFYLNLSEGERAYAKDIKPEEGVEYTHSALADIDERIQLLERELSTIERRKRAEFETKHEQNVLRMPFTGRLQYNITLPEDLDKPFEFAQGAMRTFATVCDDSSFYITLSITDTDLSLLPENRFSAYVALPAGKQLRGTFAFRRVEKNTSGAGDMLVYFFRVPEEDHKVAYNMLGSNAQAVLLYSPDEGVESISKASLLQHPAAPDCEDWKQLVSRAYPGYVVVLVTEREILIRQQGQSITKS